MNYFSRVLESTTKTLLCGESILLSKCEFIYLGDFQWTDFMFESISDQVRGKKVKAKGSTRNPPRNSNPKHRGWKQQDGSTVSAHKILATQRQLRWHPGLNVRLKIKLFHSKYSFSNILVNRFEYFLGWFW